MSRIFGPVRQAGYVVRDIETALQHWTTVLGIGPFYYVEQVPLDAFTYRGEPSAIDVSIALANSGDLQIELIQQRNDAPSMYRDFINAGHEGLQHLAYWPASFETALNDALATGYRIGQEGSIGEPGRFAYLETEAHPGTVIELSDVSGPKGAFFEHIRSKAAAWDGQHPVRVTRR